MYKPYDIEEIKQVLFEKYEIKIGKNELKKLLKEENLIVALELAVREEKFKKEKKIHRKLEL